MELLMLVYSYTDTNTIQAIMMEVPGTWASIINPQYQKTLREFQNTVKYHEESTLGYQFDPSIRWNIVVSRFHLIDGF
jgi:hypothetical protein